MGDLNASSQHPADELDSGQPSSLHLRHIGERPEIVAIAARREREQRRQHLKILQTNRGRVPVGQQQTSEHWQHMAHMQQMQDEIAYYVSKIPKGWLNCPKFGEELHGIVPSKIGLVIDLTNTDWYYPSSCWKNYDIKYVKIRCKGGNSVPDNESVNIFVSEISSFVSCQSKKYVLVHCTYGYNLTGFMVVHFLVRMLSLSVTQAMNMFADARPPGIYRPSYIDALYSFYHEGKPEWLTPSTPEWKRSSDLDPNSEVVTDEDEADDASPAALVVQGITMCSSMVEGENYLIAFGGYNGKYNNEVFVMRPKPRDLSPPKKILQSAAAAAAAASVSATFAITKSGKVDVMKTVEKDLINEIKASREKKAALELSIEDVGSENVKLREKIAEIRNNHADLSKELDSVQGQLIGERSRCFNLEAQIAELEKALLALPSVEKDVQLLRNQKSAYDDEVSNSSVKRQGSGSGSGGVWDWIAGNA